MFISIKLVVVLRCCFFVQGVPQDCFPLYNNIGHLDSGYVLQLLHLLVPVFMTLLPPPLELLLRLHHLFIKAQISSALALALSFSKIVLHFCLLKL